MKISSENNRITAKEVAFLRDMHVSFQSGYIANPNGKADRYRGKLERQLGELLNRLDKAGQP